MWRPPERWAEALERRPPEIREHLPYTAKLEMESLEMRQDYYNRIHAAFATLRGQIEEYRPDALIVIGDDQGDMFDDANNPIFSIYTGDEPSWGRRPTGDSDLPIEERPVIHFPNHGELARYLHKGLVKKGFDVANVARFDPRGNPVRGISHMVSAPLPALNPALDIPLVNVFINEYYPPLPSAERCAALGRAIAEVVAERPERIAIYASGGLSHFPGEFNVGWIDTALDHWILERLERNDVDALNNLFTFDSINMRAGTGEVRAWIAVAAAMNRPAKVVDYVPAHCTVTGCGFVYWPAVESVVDEANRIAARAGA
jgi:protocatechuate 4,5-dioxygenase beta chain